MAITLDNLFQYLQGLNQLDINNELDLSHADLSDKKITDFLEKIGQISFNKLIIQRINLSHTLLAATDPLLLFLQRIFDLSAVVEIDLSHNLINQQAAEDFLTKLFPKTAQAQASKLIIKKIDFSHNPIESKEKFSLFAQKISHITGCEFTINEATLDVSTYGGMEKRKQKISTLLQDEDSDCEEITSISHLPEKSKSLTSRIFKLTKNNEKSSLLRSHSHVNYSSNIIIDDISSAEGTPPVLSLSGMMRRWILREEWVWFLMEKMLLSRNPQYRAARRQEPWRHHLFLSNAVPLRMVNMLIQDSEESQLTQKIDELMVAYDNSLAENANEITAQLKKYHLNETSNIAALKKQHRDRLDTSRIQLEIQQKTEEKLRAYQKVHLKKLKPLQRIHILRTAINHFAHTALPLAGLALILHDALKFSVFPTLHDGVHEYDLVTGFYRQAWGQAGGFFDGFPNEVAFWALPGSVLLTPMAMLILESAVQHYYFANPERIYRTLHNTYQNSIKHPYWQTVLQSWPYSPYRNALSALRFLWQWDKDGGNLYGKVDPLLPLVTTIASTAPFLMGQPAMAALSDAADAKKLSADPTTETPLTAPIRAAQNLQNLTLSPSGITRETAHYYRWTLGERTTGLRHVSFTGMRLLALGLWSYTSYRTAQMFYARGTQAREFFTAQNACQSQNYQWRYSPMTGEYDCTVCGDWLFVRPNLRNNTQACLNGLLAMPRSESVLLAGLEHLQHFSGFSVLDFSTWNFSNWHETWEQRVLAAVAPLTPHWQTANFSVPVVNPLWPADRRLSHLANFLNTHSVDTVDMSRLNIGENTWSSFLQAWQSPHHLTGLLGAQNGLTDQSMVDFSSWASNHSVTLTRMDFYGNAITETGLSFALPVLAPNQTDRVNFAYNQLSGASLTVFANWLPTSGCTELRIGEQDLTGGDFFGFGTAVRQTPGLRRLSLPQANMDDIALLTMGQSWAGQRVALEELQIAGNALTGRGIATFGIETSGTALTRINWSNNPLGPGGFQTIQSILPNVTWTEITLTDILVDAPALSHFWQSLVGTSIRSVTADGFDLGDEAFAPLMALWDNGSVILDRFNANGNRLSNDFAGQLLQSACRAGVSFFSLEDNRLSVMFDFLAADALHYPADYHCTHLYLAGNEFSNEDIAPLMPFIPQSPFRLLDLSRSQVGDETAEALARSLLTPIPAAQDLMADGRLADLDRYFRRHAHAASRINRLVLADTQITAEGASALKRVGAHLPDLVVRFPQQDPVWTTETALSNAYLQGARSLPANIHSATQPLAASFLLSAIPFVNTLLLLFVFYRLMKLALDKARCHRAGFFTNPNIENTRTNISANISANTSANSTVENPVKMMINQFP